MTTQFAPIKPIFNNLFDEAYTHLVEHPWREANAQSEKPWAASPHLKQQWADHLGDPTKSPEERTACAVGLSRSSQLTHEECDLVNEFFANADIGSAHPDIVALLLVTGASPPSILWPAYFKSFINNDPTNDQFLFWLLVGWFFRSPANVEYARTVLAHFSKPTNSTHRMALLQSAMNPFVTPLKLPRCGSWQDAAWAFHPANSNPTAHHALASFATALRWDVFAFTTRLSVFLPPPLHWASAARRQVSSDPFDAPLHTLHDPPRSVIQFMEGNHPLLLLWKYYLPLFNWPWDTPIVPHITDPSLALAYLLVGHPPHPSWLNPTLIQPILDHLRCHPCWPTEA